MKVNEIIPVTPEKTIQVSKGLLGKLDRARTVPGLDRSSPLAPGKIFGLSSNNSRSASSIAAPAARLGGAVGHLTNGVGRGKGVAKRHHKIQKDAIRGIGKSQSPFY